MRAIVQDVYGGPEVLRLAEVPKPVPGPGEVLIKVSASSVNAADWHLMRGDPLIARRMDPRTFGRHAPRNPIRGVDVAGVVASLGRGVDDLAVGDRVFGEAQGAFAEYATAPRQHLARSPAKLSDEQAAALPLAAGTAYLALCEVEPPAAGSRLVVNGASGGVGRYAVQLGIAAGATVVGVCSSRNVDQIERLGAQPLNYETDDVASQVRGQDIVLDLVGNRSLRDWGRVLRRGGTLLLSGGGVWSGGSRIGPVGLIVRGRLASPYLRYSVHVVTASPSSERLERIAGLADGGILSPLIEQSYPLERAADAVRHLEQQHARAKIVITMSASADPAM
ncbi:MAG TPA: NADP-dependent oxidoreductase [Microlunatus sp.]|nr:NADP-dependent oxidoreductase [Microlunatus sp.]